MAKKTVTLIWTKAELDLMCRCMSRHLPTQPLLLSAEMEKYSCPTCYSPAIKKVTNFCNACGQSLDWETAETWESELLGKLSQQAAEIPS